MPSNKQQISSGFFHALLSDGTKPAGKFNSVTSSLPGDGKKYTNRHIYNDGMTEADQAQMDNRRMTGCMSRKYTGQSQHTEFATQEVNNEKVPANLSFTTLIDRQVENLPTQKYGIESSRKAVEKKPATVMTDVNTLDGPEQDEKLNVQPSRHRNIPQYFNQDVHDDIETRKGDKNRAVHANMYNQYLNVQIEELIDTATSRLDPVMYEPGNTIRSSAPGIDNATNAGTGLIQDISRQAHAMYIDTQKRGRRSEKPINGHEIPQYTGAVAKNGNQAITPDNKQHERERRIDDTKYFKIENNLLSKQRRPLELLQADMPGKVRQVSDFTELALTEGKTTNYIPGKSILSKDAVNFSRDKTVIGMTSAIKDLRQKYDMLLSEKNAEKARNKRPVGRQQVIKETVIKQASTPSTAKSDAFWDRRFMGRLGIRISK